MTVSRALGYTVLTLTTIGISQIVGACGLFCTACKIVYDKIQYSRYLSLYQKAMVDRESLSHLCAHYQQRLQDNDTYIKAFSASLISFSLNHALGFMEKSFAVMVSDIFLAVFDSNSIRQRIFPLNGQSRYISSSQKDIDVTAERETMMKEWGASAVKIKVGDFGHTINALWIPFKEKAVQEALTVIVIPGRASVLEHLKGYAEWYRKKGFNVLLYNPRGYPESGPLSFKTAEHSLYEDIEAVTKSVKEELCGPDYPNRRIVYHGISIGGASAVHGASENEGSHVVTDISFSSGKDAAKRLLKNSFEVGSYTWLSPFFTDLVIERLVNDLAITAFGPTRTIGKLTLTHFDNEEKIKRVRGKYLGLHANQDFLMDLLRQDKDGKLSRKAKTHNLTKKIADAYNFSREPSAVERCVEFSGGHELISIKDDAVDKELSGFIECLQVA